MPINSVPSRSFSAYMKSPMCCGSLIQSGLSILVDSL